MIRSLKPTWIAFVALLALTTACGEVVAQQGQGATAPQETAAPPAKRLVLPDYQFGAPLRQYLGSKDRFSVIKAKVASRGQAEYAEAGADGGRPQIFTPYVLEAVEVLRGPRGPISRMLLEGGTVGTDTVEVEGGPIEPDVGALIYAVVLGPGADAQPVGTVRGYHVLPVTDAGRVFLPEWIAFDEQHPNDGTERFAANGKETRGRTVDGSSADRAMRQP